MRVGFLHVVALAGLSLTAACTGTVTEPEPLCIPGASLACACPDGRTGAQVCANNGVSLGACVCTGGAADGGAVEPDAGTPDAGTPDAGTPDAGTPDAGTPDAGTPDAGTPDAGTPDSGTPVSCADDNGGCDENATCTQSGTGVSCACNSGFSGDGVTCTDINECLVDNGGCAASATCTNTVGSRDCACNPGYFGSGFDCTDIDECAILNGGCSDDATCTNTPGGRTCACKSGYQGNGETCTDVNECLANNGGCSANATCTNTAGSKVCTCFAGFAGDGVTCTDINECLANNGGCSANATCTNTAGSKTCACNAGFSGDGVTCTDINECLANNGGCSANATCTNTPGSNSCACNVGFVGDGYTCSSPPTLGASPLSVALQGTSGTGGSASTTVVLTNTGGSFLAQPTVNITYSSGSGWLTAQVTAGSLLLGYDWEVALAASATVLSPGTYAATVSITSAGATNSPLQIPVTFVVSGVTPDLALSGNSVSFTGVRGAAPPAAKTLTATSSTAGSLSKPTTQTTYGSGSGWLNVTVTGTAEPYALSFTPVTAGLAAGTYTATVSVSSAGALSSPATVTVSMTLAEPPPSIALSKSSVALAVPEGKELSDLQSVEVTNAGGGTLGTPGFTVTYPQGVPQWLTGFVSGAASPYTLYLQADPTGLAVGTYQATLNVSGGGAANTVSIPVTLEVETSWTVFVYGHADHNLSQSLITDIAEMNAATFGKNVRVVVYADFMSGNTDPAGVPFPSGTKLYFVLGNGQPPVVLGEGEKNFDDPAVLAAAVGGVFNLVPSTRHAVVMWDHGGSWPYGFGGDSNDTDDPSDDGTAMKANVVAAAISTGLASANLNGVRPLEFLAFDTCLMAGNEVMYEFRDLAQTYLAAAELDFGDGWDYTATLSYIGANAEATAQEVATAEVGHWDAHHANASTEDRYLRAHAAFDLSAVAAYASAWSDLRDALLADPTLDWAELARKQFRTTPAYESHGISTVSGSAPLRDMGQFVAQLGQLSGSPSVVSAAQSTAGAMGNLLISGSLGSLRTNGQVGLHGELPLARDWSSRATAYKALAWHLATGWGDVLDRLDTESDTVAPVVSTVAQNTSNPTASALPNVTYTVTAPDHAQANIRLYASYSTPSAVLDLGLIGSTLVDYDPVTPATYSYDWNGLLLALEDATQASYVALDEWIIPANGTALYTIGGKVSYAGVDYPARALFESGGVKVDTFFIGLGNRWAAFTAAELNGATFTPALMDYVAGDYSYQQALTLTPAGLGTAGYFAGAGDYYLATSVSDVWGNVGGTSDTVTLSAPLGP